MKTFPQNKFSKTGEAESVNVKQCKTMLDFFKPSCSKPGSGTLGNQAISAPIVVKVTCPACSELISEARINWHLDQDCSSRVAVNKKKRKNKSQSTGSQNKKVKTSTQPKQNRENVTESKDKYSSKHCLVLSDSDEDFCFKNKSPLLFDHISEGSSSSKSVDSSQRAVYFDASMLDTQLVVEDEITDSTIVTKLQADNKQNSSSNYENDENSQVLIESDSAKIVRSMLEEDWDLIDYSNTGMKTPVKRKTFQLNRPRVLDVKKCSLLPRNEIESQTTDVINIKSKNPLIDLNDSANNISNCNRTTITENDHINKRSNLLNNSVNKVSRDEMINKSILTDWDSSDDSDDFEPKSQSFRTPIKQTCKQNSFLSRSNSSPGQCQSPSSSKSPKQRISKTLGTSLRITQSVSPDKRSFNKRLLQSKKYRTSDHDFSVSIIKNDDSFNNNTNSNNFNKLISNINSVESNLKDGSNETESGKCNFTLPNIDITYESDEFDSSESFFIGSGLPSPERSPTPSPARVAKENAMNFPKENCNIRHSSECDKLLNRTSFLDHCESGLKYPNSKVQQSPTKMHGYINTFSCLNDVKLSPTLKRKGKSFGLTQVSPKQATKKTKTLRKVISENNCIYISQAKKSLFKITSVVGNYKEISQCNESNIARRQSYPNSPVQSDHVFEVSTSPLKLIDNYIQSKHKPIETQTRVILSNNLSKLSPVSSPSKITSFECSKSPLKSSPSNSPLKQSGGNTNDSNPEQFRNHTGYYLDNFLLILNTVCGDPDDIKLFNAEDKEIIHTFHGLSLPAKKLYVRLFQRNTDWKRIMKIEYKDICDKEDTILYVKELIYAGLAHSEADLVDVKEVLELLDKSELVALCKTMKVSFLGRSKGEQVESLLANSRAQPTIADSFFRKVSSSNVGGGGAGSRNSLLLKRSKQLVGQCCLLNKSVRQLFLRVLTLYSMPRYDDDNESGQHQQLVTLLRQNLGHIKYPTGIIRIREHAIFRNREDIIILEQCQDLCSNIKEAQLSRNWSNALALCEQAGEMYSWLKQDPCLLSHDASLPCFLRKFSSISILVYLKTCQVDVLQRLRMYSEAIKVLRELLRQKSHLQDYRGAWYDRLSLNLHQHLKMTDAAYQVVCDALSDPEVRVGHRLNLSIRGQRLVKSAGRRAGKKKTSANKAEGDDDEDEEEEEIKKEREVVFMSPKEAPTVVIEGRSMQIDQGAKAGYRRVFMHSSGGDEVTACSVEELALAHYTDHGYPQGVHGEGSTVNSIFGLLFWAVLYESSVADAFRLHCAQSAPLDLDSPHFNSSRREQLNDRLAEVSVLSEAGVAEAVETVWAAHNQEQCLVNWDVMRSPQYAQGLILSLGVELVAKICGRLAKDHRFTRSGFPDLIVWDPDARRSRVVEVKGPGDRLSSKQVLWLDFLLQSGAAAEVCHVQAIGAWRVPANTARLPSPSGAARRAETAAWEAGEEECGGDEQLWRGKGSSEDGKQGWEDGKESLEDWKALEDIKDRLNYEGENEVVSLEGCQVGKKGCGKRKSTIQSKKKVNKKYIKKDDKNKRKNETEKEKL